MPATSSPLPDSLIGFELAFWVRLARLALREEIVPEAVHLNRELPATDRYTAYIGTAPRWADFNGLTFAATDARKPFLTANEAM